MASEVDEGIRAGKAGTDVRHDYLHLIQPHRRKLLGFFSIPRYPYSRRVGSTIAVPLPSPQVMKNSSPNSLC